MKIRQLCRGCFRATLPRVLMATRNVCCNLLNDVLCDLNTQELLMLLQLGFLSRFMSIGCYRNV